MSDDVAVLRRALGRLRIRGESTAPERKALANLMARLEVTEAVVEAARPFAGQPGVRLSEPFETAWLDLCAALAALDKENPNG